MSGANRKRWWLVAAVVVLVPLIVLLIAFEPQWYVPADSPAVVKIESSKFFALAGSQYRTQAGAGSIDRETLPAGALTVDKDRATLSLRTAIGAENLYYAQDWFIAYNAAHGRDCTLDAGHGCHQVKFTVVSPGGRMDQQFPIFDL